MNVEVDVDVADHVNVDINVNGNINGNVLTSDFVLLSILSTPSLVPSPVL